jgi:hypothetical protein
LKSGSCTGARGRAEFAELGWVRGAAAVVLVWARGVAAAGLGVALAEGAGSAVIGVDARALSVGALVGRA